MLKIDLHIHTIATISDPPFEFSCDALLEYVQERNISAIAITNHNCFSLPQYFEIVKALDIKVFPGIEVNLDTGHILVISEHEKVEEFSNCCNRVTEMIQTPTDSINVDSLSRVFGNLHDYLLIPHYEKEPMISRETIEQLGPHVSAGEVSSIKKFIQCSKSSSSLVPVLFSDCRPQAGVSNYPTRQTYVNAGTPSLPAIKYALQDKAKSCLDAFCNNDFFVALDNGLRISTKLNVILGGRSSGKTFTLKKIAERFGNVKHIEQFSLLEKDDKKDLQLFNEMVSRYHSLTTEEHLYSFRTAVNEMVNVDLENKYALLEQYVNALKKKAVEIEREDAFSKPKIFSETNFPIESLDNIRRVIESVRNILDNSQYQDLIFSIISKSDMISLLLKLIKVHDSALEENQKKKWINELLQEIRDSLGRKTSATRVPEIDLYDIAHEQMKVDAFSNLVKIVKRTHIVISQRIQGFYITATCRPFESKGAMNRMSAKKEGSFANAFAKYSDPYRFLLELRKIDNLPESEYYKFFVHIDYKILNKYQYEVSGGERSEFRLLREIADATQFDMLLIDEPESSFDNLFLKNEVNDLIKSISQTIPVIVVTHNNTVGASIKPDYIIYTKRAIDGNCASYEVYSGYPTDLKLQTVDGKEIDNRNIMLDCLEAGQAAYIERGSTYEALKG